MISKNVIFYDSGCLRFQWKNLGRFLELPKIAQDFIGLSKSVSFNSILAVSFENSRFFKIHFKSLSKVTQRQKTIVLSEHDQIPTIEEC